MQENVMKMENGSPLLECFNELTDFRIKRKTDHKLLDIVALTICAVISGADTWVDVETYGKAKREWLGKFLDLSNGIPSHDTIGRVFALLDPGSLRECFLKWVGAVFDLTAGQVVPIDGKTVRRSMDSRSGRLPIHMVSAWASANNVVLGQLMTEEKSNEITAIPALLATLALKGCIVTIDAMGTQKQIAGAIIAKEADYVLALKDNHPKLRGKVEAFFANSLDGRPDIQIDYCQTEEKGHGRLEKRQYWMAHAPNSIPGAEEWPGLKTIGMVISGKTIGDKRTVETRCFLSSLDLDVKSFASAVRTHWSIESMHWTLDIAFREDESRARAGHAAENMVVVRHIALSLLKNDRSRKGGIKCRRLTAGWDDAYLLKLLTN
jgi:predicted transposase YbfD/YdcC